MLNCVSSSTTAIPGQADLVAKQRRALRKLLRDLVAFTGTAINDLADAPRKASQPKRRRLLYRRADRLTNADLDRLVGEIGIDRWWSAAERATQPRRRSTRSTTTRGSGCNIIKFGDGGRPPSIARALRSRLPHPLVLARASVWEARTCVATRWRARACYS
jgi:hypothetical protein